jgi:hypothetical protein
MLRLSTLALLLALGASKLENVQLRWKPTDQPGELRNLAVQAFKDRKVVVKPFTDTRQDKALIGQNTEDSTPRNVTTMDDVGAFCSTQLGELLKESGVSVAAEGGGVVITGKVMRFMVDEGNMYQGTVALNLTISAKGKEIWNGIVTGESKRWGRSYKYENYMEAISDALMRATEALLRDPKLMAAIDARS